LTQLDRDEIIGMHQTKLHPPEVVHYSTDSFRQHQKLTEEHKLTTPIEIRVVRKDGAEVPVEVLATKAVYKGKDCLVGNFRDISERKEAERLLQEKNKEIAAQNEALNLANLELIAAKEKVEESEFKLKEAQQIAHVGNWELSILTNKLLWSDEIFEMFDCQPNEFEETFEAFLEFVHPDDREKVISAYSKSLETRTEYQIEHRIITKNNRIKHVFEKCATTFNEEGKPVNSFGIVLDITNQKQIELELAESTERFKALHNASFGGIAIHDRGKILECNQGLSEMTGYSFEELVRMDGLLLIAPEHRELVRNNILTGYEKPYEADGLRKNGEQFPMRLEGRNIPYKGKNVRTVEFRDITENKRAEEALRKSEERYALIIDASEQGIWDWNIETDEVFFSEQWKRQIGYKDHELENVFGTWAAHLHPDEKEACENAVQAYLNNPVKHFFLEFRFRHKDGSYRWIFNKASSIKNQKGKVLRMFGAHLDITDRKQFEILLQEKSEEIAAQNEELNQANLELNEANEKAEESKERYRSLLDHLEAGIVVHAPDTSIVLNNPKAAELLGLSESQMRGKTAMDKAWKFVNEDNTTLSIDQYPVNRIVKSKRPIKNQVLGIHQPGKIDVTWVTVNGFPKLDNTGNITEIVISIIDITEKKQAEIEIRNLNETLEKRIAERTRQLEATNKELTFHLLELEQFSYVSNHDLQEPLRTLVQFSELIKENYSGMLDEDGNKYIDFITKAALRMKELVKDLLEYSLLGKESIISTIDCSRIIEAVLIDLDVSIKKSNARIVVGELPAITGYETELRLLFQNLIANAIKYQKTGNVPEIIISAESQHNDWLFKISDNGIGIDEKYRDKIFILFQRLHNRNEYDGTGIGLAHCKKIVELHGGSIWMESTIDKGSTFMFTIPKT
jgi:PAS domain S-box-containing protein